MVSPQFKNANDLAILAKSENWEDVYQLYKVIFERELNILAENDEPQESLFGLTGRQAVTLYKKYKDFADKHDRFFDIRDALTNLSLEEEAALMHFFDILGILRTSAYITADRNNQNYIHGEEIFDRNARIKRAEEKIQTKLDLGWDAAKIKRRFSHLKFWPSLTPHPTVFSNSEGKKALTDLTKIADEMQPNDRTDAYVDIIKGMMTTPLTQRRKKTYEEENTDGLDDGETYMHALVDWMWDQQTALNNVLGENSFNLLDIDMHMDAAPRFWQGGDADGKPVPATILFDQRLRSARRGVMSIIQYLDAIPVAEQHLFADVLRVYNEIESGLNNLFERLEQIRAMDSRSDEFQGVKDEFIAVFKDRNFDGQDGFKHGPELTKAVTAKLRSLCEGGTLSPEANELAWKVRAWHKQVGIAAGKQEIRHNSEDIQKIMNNLYEYMRIHYNDNGKAGAVRLKRIIEEHGADLEDILLKANPDGWTREILERFRVVRDCYNHNRMGAAIIAEAELLSAIQQQVITDAMGIKNIAHMPLTEKRKTIEKLADIVKEYDKYFGKKNLESRLGELGVDNPHSYQLAFVPGSDSHRQDGQAIEDLIWESLRALVEQSLDIKVPTLIKLGTGMSPSRCGTAVQAVPRMLFYIISQTEEYQNDTLTEEQMEILEHICSFVSLTIQGRDPSIRFGTSAQAYDLIDSTIEEIFTACLALEGRISPEVVGTEAKLGVSGTETLEASVNTASKSSREKYDLMRTDTCSVNSPHEETRQRLDQYTAAVSAPRMAKLTGTSARPDARVDIKDPKAAKQVEAAPKTTEQRAIGSQRAIERTETAADASYTTGHQLVLMYQDYKDKKYPKHHLIDTFWADKFFKEHKLPNVMAGLMHAYYEHGFDALEYRDTRWSVKDVIQAQKRKYKGMSENLAFHAVLAYDAILATALLEALLNTVEGNETPNWDSPLEDIIYGLYNENDNLAALKFGPKTRIAYPEIVKGLVIAKDDRLPRAIQHDMERRIVDGEIDSGDNRTKEILIHAACASVALAFRNPFAIFDHRAFGSRPGKERPFDILRSDTYDYPFDPRDEANQKLWERLPS